MLQVKVNSRFIELPPDFSITMNLKSPIFNDLGSASYPFKFHATPRNKQILGFLHRVENTSNPYQEFPAQVFFNEVLLYTGLLKCRVGNADNYEGQIYEGRGDFFYQAKNKSLQNFSFGGQVFASEYEGIQYARECQFHAYPERPVAFPQIFNDAYFEEQPTNENLWMYNKYFAQSQYYLDPGLYVTDVNGDRMIIVPCLYLKYVIKTLFTHLGYVIDHNFFDSHADFNRVVLYNSVNANEDPTNPYFKVNLAHMYWDYHVPRISINDFIKGYESFFGVVTFINPLTRKIDIYSLEEIITSGSCVEFSTRLISTSTELEDKIQGFHMKMNLDGGDNAFQQMITLEEEPLLASIKPPVDKLSDLPPWPASAFREKRFVVEKDIYYVLTDSGAWIPSFNYDTWALYTEFVYKAVDQSISTKFSTLFMDSGWDVICTNKMIEWGDISPRVIFANPIYDAGNAFISGQNLTGNFTFYYTGPNGMFSKFYKTFLAWRIKSKNVKLSKLLTVVEIRNFDFSKKYMIHGVKYLFRDLQVTIKMDSIQPAILNGLVIY
jgi:hypothetical protein